MKTDYNIDTKYIQAKQRVEDLKGFYTNLISYCIFIPMLAVLNYYTSWDNHKWFLYPMIFWGLGVLIHGLTVFGFGSGWEERKVRELMEKDTNNYNKIK